MELTREQIKEGNEAIAKFMGWFQDIPGVDCTWFVIGDCAKYVAYSESTNYPHRDLPFHRDWNYLMKVIDKIGTVVYHREGDAPEWNWKNHTSYNNLFNQIFSVWLRNRFDTHKEEFNLMNDLTSVWSGCVAYINYYNNGNKEI